MRWRGVLLLMMRPLGQGKEPFNCCSPAQAGVQSGKACGFKKRVSRSCTGLLPAQEHQDDDLSNIPLHRKSENRAYKAIAVFGEGDWTVTA